MSKELFEELDLTIAEIRKENQELKRKYLNAVAEYETTMAEKKQLNSLVNSCQGEIRQLKKQLEDKTEDYKRMKDNFDSKVDVITEIDTQQKEFIKYLEEQMQQLKEIDFYQPLQKMALVTYEHISKKYNDLIG